jgi:hypothetical protein
LDTVTYITLVQRDEKDTGRIPAIQKGCEIITIMMNGKAYKDKRDSPEGCPVIEHLFFGVSSGARLAAVVSRQTQDESSASFSIGTGSGAEEVNTEKTTQPTAAMNRARATSFLFFGKPQM